MVDSIVVGEDSYLLGYEAVLLAVQRHSVISQKVWIFNNVALTA
jgi:hypothetical protein